MIQSTILKCETKPCKIGTQKLNTSQNLVRLILLLKEKHKKTFWGMKLENCWYVDFLEL